MQITDRTIIITGGASGLGAACIRAIVERGGNAVIFDLNQDKGDALVTELGAAALFCSVNVIEEQSVRDGIAAAKAQFGDIHGVVNCAGTGDAGRTVGRDGAYPLERFQKIINLNLVGTFNVTRLVAEAMQTNEVHSADGERGAIVNVASVAAIDGQIGQVAYSASKAGVVGMTLPIARDFGKLGIRINTICPGVFMTELMGMAPQEMIDGLAANAQFPPRLGDPSEFAHMALSLIENTYINGETIRLDAAMRMPPR
jgi:NAD(P)-dependent dehydrogenase (short-subunit alcohol dehydrogenase family)